jgi:hypothetical protein
MISILIIKNYEFSFMDRNNIISYIYSLLESLFDENNA